MKPARRITDAWARYAELISAQLDALEEDEIELVDALGRQRQQLADEIETLGFDGSDSEALAEVRRQVAACREADTVLRQRLASRHEENVVGTRRVDRWRKALHGYARGLPGAAAIDVKL